MPRRLTDFLKREAKRVLEPLSHDYAARIGAKVRRVSVRDTASRWGSCSANQTISYCWRLILAPDFVLDYVVAHEVAHLREMNHGPRFWKLVRTLVPTSRRRRPGCARTAPRCTDTELKPVDNRQCHLSVASKYSDSYAHLWLGFYL
ncbi:MAG: M48 family metallopeptidase [Rhizomicrobium sp.]